MNHMLNGGVLDKPRVVPAEFVGRTYVPQYTPKPEIHGDAHNLPLKEFALYVFRAAVAESRPTHNHVGLHRGR